MSNVNIHTTLGINLKPQPHEIQVITRGATSSIDYYLFLKPWFTSFDNIEQMTFSFKQGKTITYFNMIEYFVLTTDQTFTAGKTYYLKLDVSTIYNKFVEAEVTTGETIPANTYYETFELASGEDYNKTSGDNWQIDRHFYYHDELSNYIYISFMLFEEDTKKFKLTYPDDNMKFEVTTRIDTDDDSTYKMNGRDSIIIDPQHPLAVVDSIYVNIE